MFIHIFFFIAYTFMKFVINWVRGLSRGLGDAYSYIIFRNLKNRRTMSDNFFGILFRSKSQLKAETKATILF